MSKEPQIPQSQKLPVQDLDQALTRMLAATAGCFGQEFIEKLAQQFCLALGLDFSLIGRFPVGQDDHVHSLAVYHKGEKQTNFIYELENSPCFDAAKSGVCCVKSGVQSVYPKDQSLAVMQAEGYLGVALRDSTGNSIGVVVVMSRRPLQQVNLLSSVLQIFAYRVAAELERQIIMQDLQDEVEVNQTQLDSVPALMFMLDSKGKFLRWNQYYRTKFGFTFEEMRNREIGAAVHPDDRKRLQIEVRQAFEKGFGTIYLDGLTRDGERVPLLATAKATHYQGQPVLVGVALDMTVQRNVEHDLLRSQGRLARKNSQLSLINTLIEKLHTSHKVNELALETLRLLQNIDQEAMLIFTVVAADGQNLTIRASLNAGSEVLKARKIFPLFQEGSPTATAMQSRQLEVFSDIYNDPLLDDDIKTLIKKENVKGGVVIPLIYKNEILGGITIGFRSDSIISPDEIDFYQTIGSSVSLALANARQFEQMESLATHDTLTNLPNRNALTQDCEQQLKDGDFDREVLGLILIDLDRFKEINDTLDHQIGDKLLSLIGPRLDQTVSDKHCKSYRLGGDEFCILVVGKPCQTEIEAIAQKLREAIAQPFMVDGLNLEVSSSIGIAVTSQAQHSASEMLRCAELAMYYAKNQGAGITLYTPALDADTNERFVIMAEMASAIREDQLVLHYQPKVDLHSGKIIGCEALVRWQHKQYGLLPPLKFIPLVELTQLIHPLTYWVMKTAMAQIQQWKAQGMLVNVAVNLSTRNLTDDEFIQQVETLMQTYQISPSEIEFEVTETALMGNFERAKQQLFELHSRGIKCSLDDYGTGYSSLAYIKKLPLDILKIDRSFVSLMLQDKIDQTIAQSTINLAHDLGMKVVAEGVEDRQTLIELRAQGCDFIQGYFISKPLQASEFAEFYQQYSDQQEQN